MTVPTAIQSEGLFSGLDPIADTHRRDRSQDASGRARDARLVRSRLGPSRVYGLSGESDEHRCAPI
jgi:hypothetical protein